MSLCVPWSCPQGSASKAEVWRFHPDRYSFRLCRGATRARFCHAATTAARRGARVDGIVLLQVSVDETGTVGEVRLIRGHPLLYQAAIDAVRQWRYSPTLLNGEPIPVVATVTVNFVLE